MEIEKIPQMDRKEYDQLIIDEYVCRIAFKGKEHTACDRMPCWIAEYQQ